MKQHLRDPYGGFVFAASADFTRTSGTRNQNSLMHLFEALLALYGTTKSEQVFDDIRQLGHFVTEQLYSQEGGYIPEYYNEYWRPLPVDQGGYVDIGHQFEWAFLLSQAVQQGLPQRYQVIGERLLDYGIEVGLDREHGGTYSSANYVEKRASDTGKGWWQQCETLRTLMRYAADHGREELWEDFDRCCEFFVREFRDAEYGGWYSQPLSGHSGTGSGANKGSHWKVDYHTAGMVFEAFRATGR